jgi:hypothetical protein
LFHLKTSARTVGGSIAAFALCTGIALAQSDVSVTLNGAPLTLNPGPQVQAGRVFVPLRGVFEQLGASVVYDNGTINAQKGHSRSVSLHVGSTQATVDGQPATIDVAPFIVGASTYVPLRFISQALGASVNYDASNKVVALNEGGGPPPPNMQGPPPDRAMQPPPPMTQSAALHVVDMRPARDGAAASRRPTIEANFADGRANPNTVRVSVDGLNVTNDTSRSPSGIVYNPPSDLQSGRHEVRVAGSDMNGTPFQAQWSFVSGDGPVGDQR